MWKKKSRKQKMFSKFTFFGSGRIFKKLRKLQYIKSLEFWIIPNIETAEGAKNYLKKEKISTKNPKNQKISGDTPLAQMSGRIQIRKFLVGGLFQVF